MELSTDSAIEAPGLERNIADYVAYNMRVSAVKLLTSRGGSAPAKCPSLSNKGLLLNLSKKPLHLRIKESILGWVS